MSTRVSEQHRRRVTAKARLSEALLTWYDANRRELPWRAGAGEDSDPYWVWLSEIMLQQTTVAAVAPYFQAFLARWPDVTVLARASQDEVLGAWAGLGYYSRARNLHRAAHAVARDLGGVFPRSAATLRELPGVGAYTAAAIAAIAFGEQVAAMDANAERVVARLFAVEERLPKAKAMLADLAAPLVPRDRPGDFAQALMDLGATVCLSRRPHCDACPLRARCAACKRGDPETFPRKAPKRARPLKRGAAFVAFDGSGAVYLERRPEKGLLGAMLQPPLGPWQEEFPDGKTARATAPFSGRWRRKPGSVRHGFTHFELELEVYTAAYTARPNGEGRWLSPDELRGAALPTLMRKLIAHALNAGNATPRP